MRWKGSRRSSNIEDRRGQRRRGGLVGGGLSTIVLILVALYFGVDPTFLIEGLGSGGSSAPAAPDPARKRACRGWFPSWSPIPKMPGIRFSGKAVVNTASRHWCCSRALRARRVVRDKQRWAVLLPG